MPTASHLALEKLIQQSGLQDNEKRAIGFYCRNSTSNRITALADQTQVGVSFTNSTQLSLTQNTHHRAGAAVLGGATYNLRGMLLVTSAAAGGIKLDFNNSTATFGTGTNINYTYLTATGLVSNTQTAVTAASSAAAAGYLRVEIEGVLVCTQSGSLGLRFAETAASTGATILLGSWIETNRTFT